MTKYALSSGAVIAALASVIAPASLAAASPYKIPDADAAESWELKVAAEFESGAGEDVREAPVFDITAPIRPGLETSVTFGWAEVKEGGAAREGFLDFEWAAKLELVRQDRGALASVTIEPAVTAPTGTNGLSEHAWAAELPVIVSRQIGPLELRGLFSYAHAFNGEPDEIGLGLLASFELSDTLSVGAEIGRDAPNDDPSDAETSFGVGAKWEFSPGYEVQVRLGRAHSGDEDVGEASVFLERAF